MEAAVAAGGGGVGGCGQCPGEATTSGAVFAYKTCSFRSQKFIVGNIMSLPSTERRTNKQVAAHSMHAQLRVCGATTPAPKHIALSLVWKAQTNG